MRDGIRRATVDVWVAEPIDADLDPWFVHLDEVERTRAATLPAQQASRFVQARALLRGVLGARLGCSARDVALHATCPECGGAHGRVVLAAGVGPQVSITRAGALIAVAVTDDGAVGVDIESHAAVSAAPLAGVALSGPELTAHRRRRRPARTPALARAWVTAESALKAAGTGLRTDPAELEIHSARGRRTALAPDGTRTLIADLDLGPRLAGAVALAWHGSIPARRAELGLPERPPRLAVRLFDGGAVLTGLRRR